MRKSRRDSRREESTAHKTLGDRGGVVVETFDSGRWPNLLVFADLERGIIVPYVAPFSAVEIERRQDLVRAKLIDLDCDLLIAQCWFPPATFASQSTMYWLSGFNGFRNTMTLILPANGELLEIPGMKSCNSRKDREPYSGVDDMSIHLKGAKRIAYDGTAFFLTVAFNDYLNRVCPGVEIVDMSNEIEHMKAVKSEEEIACIADATHLHDKIFASAASYIYPGRTLWEINCDITRQLSMWGADPSLFGKVIIGFSDEYGRSIGGLGADDGGRSIELMREYRVKKSDFVQLLLESPGAGGYYSYNRRYFFFKQPRPEIQALYQDAKDLTDFTISLLRPGAKYADIHEKLNDFKMKRGLAPWAYTPAMWRGHAIHGVFLPEIHAVGINTIDRPSYPYDWEDMDLMVGHSLAIGHNMAERDGVAMNASRVVIVRETEPQVLGDFPLELVVL
jgi:Xaa-Pro aminopeptidase